MSGDINVGHAAFAEKIVEAIDAGEFTCQDLAMILRVASRLRKSSE